ncbi:DUF2726 domain-containing protein [Chromatium okenii]|uniref:DUF2726 domain-containing protein n=1 Tax=Chromatium okenii TaxID=61644 RepID=UPI0026EF4BF2|nr:DUF2726 domain-containing protein [Chromatium okenii]MBV5308744.1 DUF2726 domain-containing protein [Chromatium okenii]
MAHLYFLLGLGLIVLLALLRQIWRMALNWLYPPYRADNLLFNPAQRRLKTALEQAVGRDYRLYGRIRVADVIGLRGRLTRREQEQALARLDGLSFDFLLCTPESTALVGAIALLPNSHWPSDLLRQRRLRQICTAAALPLLCIEERDDYVIADLAAQIFTLLQTRWLGVMPNEKTMNAIKPTPAVVTNHDDWDDRPLIERCEPVLSIQHDAAEPEFKMNITLDIGDEIPRITAEKRHRWRS